MSEEPKHFREYYEPSKWTQAWELDGKDHDVVIQRVAGDIVESADGKSKKLILFFAGWPKGFPVGVKIASQLWRSFHSTAPAKWIGKTITIYATTENIGGDETEVIRVRKRLPAQQSTAPKSAATPAKSPEERLAAFRTSLRTAPDLPALAKAWRLGADLMATLDATAVDSLTIEKEARERHFAEVAKEKEKNESPSA